MHEPEITLRGWLGSDVAVTETSGGPLASFRVGCTPRRRRDGGWEDLPSVWFTVKAWAHLARNATDSLRQGDPVVVQGRLVAESWRRDDGTRASRHVVVADAVGHDLGHGAAAFTRRRPHRDEVPSGAPVAVPTTTPDRATGPGVDPATAPGAGPGPAPVPATAA